MLVGDQRSYIVLQNIWFLLDVLMGDYTKELTVTSLALFMVTFLLNQYINLRWKQHTLWRYLILTQSPRL